MNNLEDKHAVLCAVLCALKANFPLNASGAGAAQASTSIVSLQDEVSQLEFKMWTAGMEFVSCA